MHISVVAKEINEWSGSVLIAGILEGTIESQINSFKTIIVRRPKKSEIIN